MTQPPDPSPEQPPAGWPGGGFGAPPQPPPPQQWPPQQPPQQWPPQQPPQQWPQQQPGPQQWAPSGYAAYAPSTSTFPGSTAALLVVSVVSVVAVGIIGIPSAVMAALAWRRHGTAPEAARRRTTTGWVVYGINFVVGIIALIGFYSWALPRR